MSVSQQIHIDIKVSERVLYSQWFNRKEVRKLSQKVTQEEKDELFERLKPKLKSLDEAERKNVLAYVNGAAMAAENRKAAERENID
jgi:hypothetical protein